MNMPWQHYTAEPDDKPILRKLECETREGRDLVFLILIFSALLSALEQAY